MGGQPQDLPSTPIAPFQARPGSTQNPQTSWMTGAGWLSTDAADTIKDWFENTNPVAVQRAADYYLAAEELLNGFANDVKAKATELAGHYKGPTAKATQEQLQYFHASVRELAGKLGDVGRPLQAHAQTLARAQRDIKTSDDLGFFEGMPFKRMHDLENKAKNLLKDINEEIVHHYDQLPVSIKPRGFDPNLNVDDPFLKNIDMPPYDFDSDLKDTGNPYADPFDQRGLDPDAFDTDGFDTDRFDTDGIGDDGGLDARPIRTDGFNTSQTGSSGSPGSGLDGSGLTPRGFDPGGLNQPGLGDNSFGTSGLDPNSLDPNGLNDRTNLANNGPNTMMTGPDLSNTPTTGYGTAGTGGSSGYGSGGSAGYAASAATRGAGGMNGAPFFPAGMHPAGAQEENAIDRTSPLYEDDDVYTGGGSDTTVSELNHRTT
ncbi:hypothetical protein FH608_004070 [Nonomuraea phyllanthi]|uniref:Uncharacterized protein n=1 Tax=Nonomuraea phyllanthi TaxID=2219224 RepID=A0A5C4WWY5_9ACTN|nr:hypothetical protein [Nonomuraea phyllanthi]KAB8197713.1 hypothetical protein FH608_004070 [Nonomuraea phyllanthi]QFY06310.1 hypothetical protein GBF35_06125 [Nonomuraea phyllanthi]